MKIPQFINGKLDMVDVPSNEYNEINLSVDESNQAIRDQKIKLHKQSLTVEEIREALLTARKNKYFKKREASYWSRIKKYNR